MSPSALLTTLKTPVVSASITHHQALESSISPPKVLRNLGGKTCSGLDIIMKWTSPNCAQVEVPLCGETLQVLKVRSSVHLVAAVWERTPHPQRAVTRRR